MVYLEKVVYVETGGLPRKHELYLENRRSTLKTVPVYLGNRRSTLTTGGLSGKQEVYLENMMSTWKT